MNSNLQTQSSRRGFTLVEMLAVIAIIGILAAIVMPDLTGSRKVARDAERVTEVAQISLALEMYYNACRQYPATLTTGASTAGCTGVTLGTFLDTIPTPPTGGSYGYLTNGAGNGHSAYVISVTMETTHRNLASDVDGTVFGSVNCGIAGPTDTIYCKQ
jgi:general secretion pathway protein G